jgi:hypothetical protein
MVTIQQLYLPGWRVALDGRRVPAAALERHVTPDGRMALPVGPGAHWIEAYYEGPPGWKGRGTVALAGVLGLIGLGVWERRAQPSALPAPHRPEDHRGPGAAQTGAEETTADAISALS